jgi:hypothetical protein
MLNQNTGQINLTTKLIKNYNNYNILIVIYFKSYTWQINLTTKLVSFY